MRTYLDCGAVPDERGGANLVYFCSREDERLVGGGFRSARGEGKRPEVLSFIAEERKRSVFPSP